MTYQELADFINTKMTEQQKQNHVSIYIQSMDEFFSIFEMDITGENEDVLDPNHFFLNLDA